MTSVVWQLLQSFVGEGDVAIDATVGNGFDTLFLAQRVGSQGLIFGFDIQEQAIASTRKRLADEHCQCSVKLYQVGHQHPLLVFIFGCTKMHMLLFINYSFIT